MALIMSTETSAGSSTSESTPLIGHPTHKISTFRFVVLLFSLYFGVFLAAVDSTVVSTLLASIASDLKVLDSVSWVATAYLVAYSAFQPLYGKLSDIYGRKAVLMVSIIIFGIGCWVCSIGSTMHPLVVGRLLSGVGAGGMLSMSTITVSDYVPSRQRGIYQGFGNIAFGTGAATGGLFGSAAQAYKGWRFAFSAQVPLALVAFLIVATIMEEKKPTHEVVETEGDHVVYRNSFERVDLVGSVTLASAVCLFMLGVTTGGNQFPWASWQVLAFFLGTILMLTLFVHWETTKAVEPVMPIWLLTRRTVLSACLTNFFCTGLTYSLIYYVPIFLTARYNLTPTQISQRIIANFVGVSTGSLGSGIIMHKTGKYWWLGLYSCIGTLFASVMFLAIPFLPETIGGTAWYQDLSFFVLGLNYAAMLTISLVALIASSPENQATATSAQYTFRGAGSSVTISLAASIFSNVLKWDLHKRIVGPGASKIIRKVSKSVEAIREAPKRLQPDIIHSYTSAATAVFILCVVCGIIGAICTGYGEEHALQHDVSRGENDQGAEEIQP